MKPAVIDFCSSPGQECQGTATGGSIIVKVTIINRWGCAIDTQDASVFTGATMQDTVAKDGFGRAAVEADSGPGTIRYVDRRKFDGILFGSVSYQRAVD